MTPMSPSAASLDLLKSAADAEPFTGEKLLPVYGGLWPVVI